MSASNGSGTVLDELADLPSGGANGSTIWLHGMGQSGRTMRAVARAAALAQRPGLRNIYLQAPLREVGLLSRDPVRAWMVQRVTQLEQADPDELRSIGQRLRAVIDREADLVGPDRVILAGFSQGAALALMLGLSHRRRLAAIVAYASPPFNGLGSGTTRLAPNRGLSIWLGHGSDDGAVPVAVGRTIRDGLVRSGYDVHWHEYPAGHRPFAGAEADLARFVTSAIGLAGPA